MKRFVGIACASLAIAAPLHAQTPEQRYADWTALDFPPAEYAERRARLFEELRALDDGVLLLPGAEGASHGETFRQLDDVWYFTGLELPSAMLVVDGQARTSVLYAPARDPRFEAAGRANDFPGRPLADDPDIARTAGIEIRDLRTLDADLRRLAGRRTLLLNLGRGGSAAEIRTGFTPDLSPEALLVLHLRATFPGARIDNAFAAIARVRSVKTAAEIGRIRRVADITQEAIAQAAARVRPGMTERELEGWFELGCRQGGAQRIPFHPIIKSGANALWPWRILASHYDRRNRALEDGDVVIFDVGCELDHYVSDVGRTFPVSGSFSRAQADALDMQRTVSTAIIAAIRPGRTFADLQRVAEAAIPAAARPYMQTGSFFGHHLGLSTGDPALTEEPLRAGMVFTVEPWYYDHDAGVSVFVEDMVLVTETGADVLTSSLPRTAAELSAMVAPTADTLRTIERIDILDGQALREPMVVQHPSGALFAAGYSRAEEEFTDPPNLYRSDDGGATWRRVDVGAVADGALGNSDVDLAIGPDGALWFLTMGFDRSVGEGTHVAVGVSRDVGRTWRWRYVSRTRFDDRPWIAIAPDGTAHVIWNDGAGVRHATSDDGNAWTEHARVHPRGGSSHLAVAADGRLAVRITPRSASGNRMDEGVDRIAISDDGGASWTVRDAPGSRSWEGDFSTPAAVPRWVEPLAWGPDGTLLSLWSEGTTLHLGRSRDEGVTWSTDVIVRDSVPVYYPLLTTGPAGRLAASWFSGTGPDLRAHVALLSDGAGTPLVTRGEPLAVEAWRIPGDPNSVDAAGEYFPVIFLADGDVGAVLPIQASPRGEGFSWVRLRAGTR